MMELLESTMSGFTRSASRRLDAELCIISLCQPELQLDAKSLNARLTKLEEQIKSGSFVSAPAQTQQPKAEPDEEMCPPPDDADAPPADFEMPEPQELPDETPVGFWTDLVAAIRQELKPPVSGFFIATPNSPVKGILQGDQVLLQCTNGFTLDMINKPEILSLVARKASAILGRSVMAKGVDTSAAPEHNARMQQLLDFGKNHSDIVKIKGQH